MKHNTHSFELHFKRYSFCFFVTPKDWRLFAEEDYVKGIGKVVDFWVGPLSLVVVKEDKKKKTKKKK